MSTVTKTWCDECGAVIPDGAAYLTLETKRVAVARKVDACCGECAGKLAEKLGPRRELVR